ncbi:XRE family transcriptional regulator [Pedobacter sp. HMF7647]|uniref:XRE family transcriptional regulator n=1 Tax=Hufsiella arboris TaxID=2695275 RepID=A0A7K1Y713_9SPHI|nr:helix-turn-helix transcriptional regulator [Hufsiella arboris]MXV50363.1 XRE family transcriptional regulator [Hufsiella arboris]
MAASRKKVSNPVQEKALRQLGDRLRKIRMEQGYGNYEKFALKHNIARAQYGRYENGEDLKFTTLVNIVHEMGMSLKDFFDEGFD